VFHFYISTSVFDFDLCKLYPLGGWGFENQVISVRLRPPITFEGPLNVNYHHPTENLRIPSTFLRDLYVLIQESNQVCFREIHRIRCKIATEVSPNRLVRVEVDYCYGDRSLPLFWNNIVLTATEFVWIISILPHFRVWMKS
jgi:hypothetical protein